MSPVKQHFNASQPPILETVETVPQKTTDFSVKTWLF